jgi:hypothetical protein
MKNTDKLREWLTVKGNDMRLALYLKYKSTQTVHNWVARGIPEYQVDNVMKFIAKGKKR